MTHRPSDCQARGQADDPGARFGSRPRLGVRVWGEGALGGAGFPDTLLEFSLWCNRTHRTFCEELEEVSDNDSQFRICNRFTLALDQQAVDHAKQSLQWQAKVADFCTQWLETPQELRWPRVNPECLDGVLVQGVGPVEPYRYSLAAAQAGEKLGVEMALRG